MAEEEIVQEGQYWKTKEARYYVSDYKVYKIINDTVYFGNSDDYTEIFMSDMPEFLSTFRRSFDHDKRIASHDGKWLEPKAYMGWFENFKPHWSCCKNPIKNSICKNIVKE